MLKELLERARQLRRLSAVQRSVNASLVATVAQKEAQLEQEAEDLRAKEAAELTSFLPLLVAKQEKLQMLEREVVEHDVHLGELDEGMARAPP